LMAFVMKETGGRHPPNDQNSKSQEANPKPLPATSTG
jgi:hypothetical protein